MVEYDLSKLDPTWQGWVVDGPPNATVLHDGVRDARLAVAGKGMLAAGPPVDELNITLRLEKQSPDDEKAHLKEIHTKPFPGVTRKLTVVTDQPDRLEWTDASTQKGKTTTSYHFLLNFQASGQDGSCRTMVLGAGAVTKEGLAQFEAACLTLHKK